MRRVPQFLLCLLTCCAFFALSGSSSIAEEKISSARRLPPQVYAYLSIRDTTELKQRFGETLCGQMLKDPELAAVKKQIKDAIAESTTGMEEKLGVKIDELLSLPQGEIAVAVVQPTGGKLSLVVMLDFGDQRATLDKLIAKAVESSEERDIVRSTEEYQDNEIVVLSASAEEEEKDEDDADFTVAYCIKDSVLIVGNQVTAIKAILVRWDGEHDSTLASNEVFRYLTNKCNGDAETRPLITWFIDPIGLLRAGLAASPDAPPQAMMVIGFLPVLGLDKLKAIGGIADMGVGDFDGLSRTMIYMEPPTTGLLNVFQFPAQHQQPPGWITADAASYFVINWSVAEAYDAVEALVDTLQGPGTLSQVLDKMSDAQLNGALHLKDDILDVLTGTIRVFSDVPDKDKPQGSRSLIALELKDADAATATLAKIGEIEGFPGESREFLGQALYEFSAPAGFAGLNQLGNNEEEDQEEGDEEEKMAGYAVVQGHLMFTNNVTLLEKIIRGDKDADKLVDTAQYKRIARFFPEKTSAAGFQKENVDVKTFYETFRSGNAEFLFGGALSGIDFSELPEYETIRGYLPPGGSFMVPDERGFVIQSFTLKKQK